MLIDYEEQVITGSEQKTASAVGEIKKGQVTRTNHSGEGYPTNGPTTTNNAAVDKAAELLQKEKALRDSIKKIRKQNNND